MLKPSKFIALLFCFFSCTFSAGIFSAQAIPTVDVKNQFKNGKTSLAGDWALRWGEWIPLADIATSKAQFKTVQLPNFVNSMVDKQALQERKYGTYILRLDNLHNVFKEPAIRMRDVSDAWQAWWVDDSGNTQFLGQSGKISTDKTTQYMRFKTGILKLPLETNAGTLVIYISTQLYDKGGMYGKFEVSELNSIRKSQFSDLAGRVALIAIGLLVVFQNILFYLFRPKERVLLLLAVFAFSILLRASVSNDYLYYLLSDPSNFDFLLRLEYITIVWPAVAAVHFFAYLYPAKFSDIVVKLGYLVMVLVVGFSLVLSLKQLVNSLFYYQITLGLFSMYVVWLIIRSLFVKSKHSALMIISCVVLVCGVINDVYASLSSAYSLYLAEYSLLLFLFAQTQYHSFRFVAALDVAEHLTDNLQQEVADKTNQLSIRNRELQDKADNLKLQHDRIKELSETDHLTGLYNRQTFDNYLELTFSQAIAYSKNLALVILDVDDFKKINDTYGHQVGDDCLKAMADYLRQANLRKDDFVARYGGEEVVIILNGADITRAEEISQRICNGLSQIELFAEQQQIVLTASFGVSEVTYNQAKNPDQLLKLADDALYKAKAEGKNRVVVAG
ncbi:diguanylate cyclase [uncultured Paraglaciecola sp.]|uniref:sensor domain-containing diguanylate cyclase n=1 Tax=uncultured Paraglaciecola sp. TaxID=1765024 RepID=UPI00260B0C5B|nr:diguanylate cyclase [uncultured Paraglaciecola sp.]